MKNLFIISIAILIFSCSKKSDPKPAMASSAKKVYYAFQAEQGSKDGTYIKAQVQVQDSSGNIIYSGYSPVYQYISASSSVIIFQLLIPNAPRSKSKDQMTVQMYQGTDKINFKKANLGTGMQSYYTAELDTCYTIGGAGTIL